MSKGGIVWPSHFGVLESLQGDCFRRNVPTPMSSDDPHQQKKWISEAEGLLRYAEKDLVRTVLVLTNASMDRHSPGGAMKGRPPMVLRRHHEGLPQGLCPG
jgi:hypothetical protein